MARTPRSPLPVRVSQLRNRIERWRRQRGKPPRMPAPLWEAAVSMARSYGIYLVAQALRLDYGSLKKRLTRLPKHAGDDAGSAGFVEIDAAQWLGRVEPGGVSVELWAVDGTKLIVRLPEMERLDMPALIEAFRKRPA